jgi:hypothetical protein
MGVPVTLEMFQGKTYAKWLEKEAVSLDGDWEVPMKLRMI